MMKRLWRMMAAVLSVVIIAGLSISVYADEPLYVYVGEITAANNELNVQVGTNLENSTEGISYKVTLGDEELELLSVSDYQTEGLHTSYALLVDVSGSIKSAEMENIKEILRGIVGNMKEGDNASIMLMGNDVYAEEFTGDKEALNTKIDGIETLSEDTNLYYAINHALDVLATSEQALSRKCLVVLSDGKDDQVSGITEKEVNEKIETINIPICTVAVRGTDEAAVETAKIMGSFARMSAGGKHMIYGLDGVDAAFVANAVTDVAENIVVLKADISGYVANGTENYLQVEVNVPEMGSAVDGYNVKSVFVSSGVVETEQEPVTESTEVIEETESQEPADAKNIVTVGVLVCIIVAIILALILGKKKKAAKNEKIKEEPVEKEVKTIQPQIQDFPRTEGINKVESVNEDVEIPPTIEVQFTRVGVIENETMPVTIKGSLVIGRKKELCDLAFEQDGQLSSKHCKFTYDGTDIILEDLGSLNGTLVNGVPITEPYPLKKDDKFYIGSMEWRIYW